MPPLATALKYRARILKSRYFITNKIWWSYLITSFGSERIMMYNFNLKKISIKIIISYCVSFLTNPISFFPFSGWILWIPIRKMFAKNLCCWLWPTIKKETKKKKKICERKGKLKKKKSVYTERKNPYQFWFLIDCVLLRSIWYNHKKDGIS